MDQKKIGQFIRTLRGSRGWSQEELSNKMFVDRTKINKLENGSRNIQLGDLLLLSEIFNVSLEEIISGERKTNKNESKLIEIFKGYLKQQNTKMKKIKFFTFLIVFVFMILFISLSVFYFFQNYSSIKIYKFYGYSENYAIENGIMVLSKEKIYFKINSIVPVVKEVEIYSEISNEKKIGF